MLNGVLELVYRWMILLRGLLLPLPPPPISLLGGTPHPGIIKINFHGSCIRTSVVGGFLLRDWTGKVFKVGAANYGHTSSLVVEVRALKDGVSLAVQQVTRRLMLRGTIWLSFKLLKVLLGSLGKLRLY